MLIISFLGLGMTLEGTNCGLLVDVILLTAIVFALLVLTLGDIILGSNSDSLDEDTLLKLTKLRYSEGVFPFKVETALLRSVCD